MKRALCALGVVLAALAVLITLLPVAEHPGILIPVFRMEADLDSAEGFEEVVPKSPPSGNPKLTIRQGSTGTIRMSLRRQYTDDTLHILLWLQGTAPDFDRWILGLVDNAGLPDGITYAINPTAFELTSNDVHNATLNIAISPSAKTGSFKLTIIACKTYSSGGGPVSSTGESFTLEVISTAPHEHPMEPIFPTPQGRLSPKFQVWMTLSSR